MRTIGYEVLLSVALSDVFDARVTVDDMTRTLHERLGRHVLVAGMDPLELDIVGSRTPYLRDRGTGEDWLDMGSFYASSALGMNHPALVGDAGFRELLGAVAVNKPANSDFVSEEYVRFVETFERVLGDPELPHLFLIEGGSAAVENALKVAFDWKLRLNEGRGVGPVAVEAMHLESAFHGRGGYTMSLTNTDPVKVAGFPKFEWPRIPAPAASFPMGPADVNALDRAEADAVRRAREYFETRPHRIACLIVEPIQGEGGDRHLRAKFLRQLQQLCHEFDALFIVDEVQTGCGTTGSRWAYQSLGLAPDVVAFGKKLQVCGVMAGRRVDEVPGNVFRVPSRINSTWGGNLTDMVRATKILEVIESEHLVANAAEVGSVLLEGLRSVAEDFPEVVFNPRGRGLFCAVSFPGDGFRDAVLAALADRRVLALGCGGSSVRFRPPLCVTPDQVAEALAALRAAVVEARDRCQVSA